MKKVFSVVAVLMLMAPSAFAVGDVKMGLSLGNAGTQMLGTSILTGGAAPKGNSTFPVAAPTAAFRVFFNDDQAIDAVVRVSVVKTDDGNDKADFSADLGLAYRHYFHKGKARPFVNAGLALTDINEGSTALGVDLGVGFGGEVWLMDNLSLSAEIGLGVHATNKFKDITFSTVRSALFGNIYF